MPAAEQLDDEWDFYPRKIDDAPASIWINLRYRQGATPSGADTMYWLRIAMVDVGDQEMGTSGEAEILWPIEDQIAESALELGVEWVVRVRTGGRWEMTFYGPGGQQAQLESRVAAIGVCGRPVTFGSRRDTKWQGYRDLLPDDERWQWMQDRKTVEVLEEKGDNSAIPRRIDHWAYFTSETQRRAFVNEVAALGFKNEAVHAPQPTHEFGARVFRTETSDLESIHASVMQLWSAARRHGGYYDGWETYVEKRP